jgi:two-component system sensor histidine kinase BaeS
LLDHFDWTIVDSAPGTPAVTAGPPTLLDVVPFVNSARLEPYVAPVPPGAVRRSAADQLLEELIRYRRSVLLAACLTRQGLAVVAGVASALGLPQTEPGPPSDRSGRPAADPDGGKARDGCVQTAAAGAKGADPTKLRACGDSVPCLADAFHSLTAEVGPVPLKLYVDDPSLGTRFARRPVVLATAAVALVTILITLLVSQRVLRPIGRLTRAARGLAHGDLSARVPERGRDELAELARTFNGMADSLQRSEDRQRQMIVDIAHELRTPLANVRGYLEALKDGVLRPDPDLFASLHEEALLQQRIVDDLQDLALAESGALLYQYQPVDVLELLRTCVTAHRAAGEAAGVAVRLADDDSAGPLVVRADTDRLRQVLGNLVTNAQRATPAGGTVTLAARAAPDGWVVITVTDTGTGMSDAELPRAFERFWRADSARARATGGSGLGLAIAREIIAAHDGTIDLASTPGQGTVVTIRLRAMTLPGPSG